MAAPTAIPHAEASAHHHHHHNPHQHIVDAEMNASSSSAATLGPASVGGGGLSRSPNNTSPRQMVSPIYTQAGRSAFSLPGPNSASTSPTTTTWYSAGFASGNSQRVRSPTAPFAGGNANGPMPVSSAVAPQRDTFPDASASGPGHHHLRSASFGSASSSLSSADLSNEPLTPRTEGVPPSARTTSSASTTPLGTSFEHFKTRRDSWTFANAPGNRWSGLASLRERTTTTTGAPPAATAGMGMAESAPASVASFGSGGAMDVSSGPMGGLLRKFSVGGTAQPLRSPPGMAAKSAAPADMAAKSDDYFGKPTTTSAAAPVPRGRQSSVSNAPVTGATVAAAAGNSQRRRPSPMGERLLMGHFNAH